MRRELLPRVRAPLVADDAPASRRCVNAFVDYSGKTVPIVDRVTGEIRPVRLFVAVLGPSN